MAKLGKPKYIQTPEIMWEHFQNYINYVNSNPIKKQVFVGKEGRVEWQLLDRPLTYEGFVCFLEDNNIMANPIHYFMNYENRYADYVTICTRIKRTIRNEQIEKGMAGIYNTSITQRLNGLVEKTDVTTNGDKIETVKSFTIIANDKADKG